jgi:anti-sigma regulatory factor (Ser/Thr protein kinase)
MLVALDLETLDAIVARLFAALDLDATLDAVVDVLVPRWTGWLSVTVEDERGIVRNRTAGRRPAGAVDTVFALDAVNGPFGSLRLASAGVESVHAGDIERLVRHVRIAIANARRFEHERNVALSFQNAALDPHPPRLGAFSFDAMYQAGRAEALVGGDWYDAFAIRDGRIVVSIGDVVGSGLDAAIAMVNVRQAIRGVAQVHPDPALMLEAANHTLLAQHPGRFVTAFVGVIDPVTQQCAFANAGHPAPYLRSTDGVVAQASGHGIPIGLDFEQTIEVHHVGLSPGTLLVLYTDGLTEATKDIAEGERRLERVLREPDLALRPRIAQHIHEEVVGAHARDDVAILVVTVGSAQPIRRWRFDPVWPDLARRARAELCAELERCGLDSVQILDAELIFAELMGNLVRYAPGTAELIFEGQDSRFVLHLLDKGPGFAFAPRLPADLFSQSGRGLFLITQLAAEFSVARRPGGGSHARIVLKSRNLGGDPA